MHQRFVDDMGRELVFGRAPERIVSLVPSETETLFALGLGDRLVGRTSYCVSPAGKVDSIPIVGGTKDVDPAKVLELSPDLVLGNQEENSRAPLEALAAERVKVFVSFPHTVSQAVAHVARIARIARLEPGSAGAGVVKELYAAERAARDAATSTSRIGVFVPIWRDPWMTFSGDTFASDVLSLCGADNVFADRERHYPLRADLAATDEERRLEMARRSPLAADQDQLRDVRYPRIRWDEVTERAPDAVLLPDEPFEFGDSHVDELRAMVPTSTAVTRVVGKHLFWAGVTLIEALPALRAELAALAEQLPAIGN